MGDKDLADDAPARHPFRGANLSGASFEGAEFGTIDLEGATYCSGKPKPIITSSNYSGPPPVDKICRPEDQKVKFEQIDVNWKDEDLYFYKVWTEEDFRERHLDTIVGEKLKWRGG